MSTSSARRYAEAALQIALRDDTLESWTEELAAATSATGDARVSEIARNSTLPVQARRELIRRVASRPLSEPVLNLVSLLLQRRRIEQLPRVALEFQALVDRRSGIIRADVTSAAPLATGEAEGLAGRLADRTGGAVELTLAVDPALLGGVVVRIGDQLIDGSVRGRLERLRSRLAAGAF
jgi:F-type H+-transporting ATPase subunit delta